MLYLPWTEGANSQKMLSQAPSFSVTALTRSVGKSIKILHIGLLVPEGLYDVMIVFHNLVR